MQKHSGTGPDEVARETFRRDRGDVEAVREATFPGLAGLPRFQGESDSLRICIATEDVAGPARNGGIGSTYAALAKLLSELGHQVTILYLRGNEIESESIEHWSDFYEASNIHFVPLPDYARIERYSPGGSRALHISYNMLRYLLDHPMDVVHVSEWGGAGYFSLLTKRQGLAFEATLFVVKASSPLLWGKLHGMQPLERLDDLPRVHAERQSIELADMVIGGSLHLLRWMLGQGYKLPGQRTFVQPNVVDIDHLSDLIARRNWAYGTRQPIDEIVFFGRLEARKGLLILFRALKRLMRQGVSLPPVTFVGKPGASLREHVGKDVIDYIEAETSDWPMKVKVLPDFQQHEALQYLLSGNRLAVMPSLIENSSLAVFESVICRIPLIASDSGGTPELIAEADRPHVLCPPHPIALADKLAEALAQGGYVAAPSFDNDINLEEWRQFHTDLGRGLLSWLMPERTVIEHPKPGVSVCVYHAEGDETLISTLKSLQAQDSPPSEILIAVDTEDASAAQRIAAKAVELGATVTVIPADDLGAGSAFNFLAALGKGELLLFLWSGSRLQPGALSTFARVADHAGADVLTCLVEIFVSDPHQGRPHIRAEMLGHGAQDFFRTDIAPMPLLVRRNIFDKLGGFTEDASVLAHDHEFVAQAHASGFVCQTVLRRLCIVEGWSTERLQSLDYSRSLSEFRVARTQLVAASPELRETLLAAKGLQKLLEKRGRPASIRRNRQDTAMGLGSLFAVPYLSSIADALVARSFKRANLGAAAGAYQERDDSSSGRLPFENKQEAAEISWISRWQARDGRRFLGSVFGVHNATIHGWIRNADRPDEIVELEGDLGDGRRRVVRADTTPPCIMPVGSEVRGHGFAFPVWRLAGRSWDWRYRSVILRIRGTDVIVGEFSIPASPQALEAIGFDGFCDFIDSGIHGWAWQPAQPDNTVDVAAFVDGKFLARTTASSIRDDLREADVGVGAYGFTIPLPKSLRDGISHRVDVVVADSGTLLKDGRRLLKA